MEVLKSLSLRNYTFRVIGIECVFDTEKHKAIRKTLNPYGYFESFQIGSDLLFMQN